MTDQKSEPKTDTAETPTSDPKVGVTTKVDTKVQEDAAKEREESGGYD